MSGFNRKNKSRGKSYGSSGSGRGSGSGFGSTRGRVDGVYTGSDSGRGRVVSPIIPTGPNGSGFGGSLDPFNGSSYDGSKHGSHWGSQLLYPFLNALVGDGSSGSIVDILNGGTQNGLKLSKEQSDALYQFLLQYINTVDQRTYDQQLTQDKRQYDWSLLQDSRRYDSPTNQLARFMGAGISRDAALQMMSGSGSGGGYGSANGEPVSNSPTSSPSVPAVSGTQGLNTANTIINGINAVGGLVSLGLSVPQSISQIRMMQNSQYLTDNQRKAYDAAVGAYSVISAAGVENAADAFGSISSAIDTLNKLANDGNESAKLFLSNGGAEALRNTAPYSSPMLAKMYKTEREATDYDTEFSLYRRYQEAQTALNQVNIQKTQEECEQLEAATQELLTRSDFNVAQANVCESTAKYYDELAKSEPAKRKYYNAQAKALRQQAELYKKQADQVEAVTVGIERTNSLNAEFDASRTAEGVTGRQWWINEKLQEVRSRCLDIAAASTKEQRDARMAALLADNEAREAASVLSTMYSEGTIELLSNDKNVKFSNVLLVCSALKDCGVSDYLRALVEADTAGFESDAFNFGLGGKDGFGFGGSHSHSTGSDLGRDFIQGLSTDDDDTTPVYLRDPRKHKNKKRK